MKDLVASQITFLFPMGLCLKHPDRVNIKGSYMLGPDHTVQYILVAVCDKNKRSTCKSRPEIVEFVKNSNFYVLI